MDACGASPVNQAPFLIGSRGESLAGGPILLRVNCSAHRRRRRRRRTGQSGGSVLPSRMDSVIVEFLEKF